ncbi:Chromosomal replication initiator, DnaA C-terminal [uncultured Caudovirales phage]|uniref:Chromosomal replication initiator, DnaA C-terminal n=1 Tax=uncultured Caudovirales phage TaxID=2100421 RepID=A0A6J5M347_9CAUD|nr:Chromosomal replication initiator, DnaA C-terminal [uncultured Caudovirales phage]
MTSDQFISQLEAFLWPDVSFQDTHKQRIKTLLTEYKPPVYKGETIVQRVVVERLITPDMQSVESIDLAAEAKEACKMYEVTERDFFGNLRIREFVSARCHFARAVLYKCPSYSRSKLARYLKKDHTTIIHYAYKAKVDCKLPPLPVPKKQTHEQLHH